MGAALVIGAMLLFLGYTALIGALCYSVGGDHAREEDRRNALKLQKLIKLPNRKTWR